MRTLRDSFKPWWTIALVSLAGCPSTVPDSDNFSAADALATDTASALDAGADTASAVDSGADSEAGSAPDAGASPDTGTDAGSDADGDSGSGPDASPLDGGPTPSGPWATAVAAGGNHSCARRANGSAWCWGSGSQGQLGTGSNGDKEKVAKPVAGLQDIAQLAAGNAHTCARRQGGQVLCWGDRFSGQTGNGDKDGVALVPEIAGTIGDATALGTGTYSSFAVRKGATAWGWGKNNDGQLLLDTLLSQAAPVQIAPVVDVKRLCGGEMYACALINDGKVVCWGRNTDGQLGHGSASYDSTPQPAGAVTGLPGVVDLACGHYHVCAWDGAGHAWCWGKNLSGQLGTGSYTTAPVNAAIPLNGLSDVVSMACGQGQTCAVRKNGDLLCWGSNAAGQAGAAGVANVYTPNKIDIGGKALAVSTGSEHGCALREDGAVACWGKNGNGQLGDGTTTQSAKAVVVLGSAPNAGP